MVTIIQNPTQMGAGHVSWAFCDFGTLLENTCEKHSAKTAAMRNVWCCVRADPSMFVTRSHHWKELRDPLNPQKQITKHPPSRKLDRSEPSCHTEQCPDHLFIPRGPTKEKNTGEVGHLPEPNVPGQNTKNAEKQRKKNTSKHTTNHQSNHHQSPFRSYTSSKELGRIQDVTQSFDGLDQSHSNCHQGWNLHDLWGFGYVTKATPFRGKGDWLC